MMNPSGRDLMQRFVDDMTDYAIVVLDIQGRVVTWNAGARVLFGYTSEEIVGLEVSRLYSKADNLLGKAETALSDALQWGRHEVKVRLLRKDGTRVEARVIIKPLSDSWQRHVGFGMLANDLEEGTRPAAQPRTEPELAGAAKPGRRARILVVDDNAGVLEEAVEQLTRLG